MKLNSPNQTSRPVAAALLLAVVANLLVPAALGATQLFCLESNSNHAFGQHDADRCCRLQPVADAEARLIHSSCTFGQICEQQLAEGLPDIPVIRSRDDQMAEIAVAAYSRPGLLRQMVHKGYTSFPGPFFSEPNIYMINNVFLN